MKVSGRFGVNFSPKKGQFFGAGTQIFELFHIKTVRFQLKWAKNQQFSTKKKQKKWIRGKIHTGGGLEARGSDRFWTNFPPKKGQFFGGRTQIFELFHIKIVRLQHKWAKNQQFSTKTTTKSESGEKFRVAGGVWSPKMNIRNSTQLTNLMIYRDQVQCVVFYTARFPI